MLEFALIVITVRLFDNLGFESLVKEAGQSKKALTIVIRLLLFGLLLRLRGRASYKYIKQLDFLYIVV